MLPSTRLIVDIGSIFGSHAVYLAHHGLAQSPPIANWRSCCAHWLAFAYPRLAEAHDEV